MATATKLRSHFRTIPNEDRKANQSFSIRVWRSLSWLERAEGFVPADTEGRFISCWIALNALYGRLDDQHRPWADRDALKTFITHIWHLDARAELRQILGHRQTAVLNLIEDPYLTIQFWENQSAPAIRQAKKDAKDAILAFQKPNRLPVLRLIFERLYVMRNQVFHGASTKGGKLNRRALQASATVLMDLLPAMLEIMIEYGICEDWGRVCYPPEKT